MITGFTDNQKHQEQNDAQVRDYAERLVISLGYNDAICTAMEFQLFNVAEELRFMQDDYRGAA